MNRDLSGIYIRVQEEDGKWVAKDVTDCNEKQIRSVMRNKDKEELIKWIIAVCKQFKGMGNQLNIVRESDSCL